MPTYRVQFELRSRLGTPLAADTLWGHLPWAVRYRDGEDALSTWLQQYEADEPPIVISDPMPSGYLPRPAVPTPLLAELPPQDEVERMKQAEKATWLSVQHWPELAMQISPDRLREILMQQAAPPRQQTVVMIHAGINRLTDGTAQEGGGLLHNAQMSYYVDPDRAPTDRQSRYAPRFDLWLRSDDSAEAIRELFDLALLGGYGRDGATGAGELAVLDIRQENLPTVDNSNAIMLLGPAVPRANDPHRGYVNFGVRCGRLGGDFAIGPTPNGSTVRQKRPVYSLLAGSVLLTDSPQPTFGRMIGGVHEDPAIRHNGITLTVPCRLDPACIEEALP